MDQFVYKIREISDKIIPNYIRNHDQRLYIEMMVITMNRIASFLKSNSDSKKFQEYMNIGYYDFYNDIDDLITFTSENIQILHFTYDPIYEQYKVISKFTPESFQTGCIFLFPIEHPNIDNILFSLEDIIL